ncbi:MAG TPA: S9 family peptidase, partial [Flavobacteriales bacterium]|nr:S9 family peptidase [Flavobacteriales bacterium]
MIRTFLPALLLLWSAAPTSAQAPTGKPFTYEQMLMLDRISGLAVDPGGHHALFNVRATDLEKNKGVSSLWMKDLDAPAKPEVRLGVSDGGAVDVQWGPDGQHIYFLSARGDVHTMQVWRTDLAGATAEQVTRLPLDVGAYRVTPDGKGIVVAMAVFPTGKEDELVATVRRLAERPMGNGTVYHTLFVRHWDTWADGTRNHLFYVPLGAEARPVALTPGFDGDVPSKPFGDEADFTISPDSKTVYFSARLAGSTEPWSTNFDIYSVPVTGGALNDLSTANKAWDANPVVSPDGKTLAYKAMKRPGFEADRFEIQLRDLATGKVTPLAAAWDRSAEGLQWSADGQSLLVTADDLGKHRLFRIDVKSGSITPLSRDGHIDAFAETPKGFVFLKSAMNSPAVLYASVVPAKGKKSQAALIDEAPVNLTQVNAGLKNVAFGAYEQFSFPGWNNETVHGYVVKPYGYQEGRKYPVAFLIHGGPQGSFGDGWSFRWNPQTYAGAGYAVVMIDFHGSTGYGQAFTDAISTHWGDRPLEDLQKGWAYALKTFPFLDGDRAAALGASYGGFMVNWIAGNWKAPWKCLVSHDGVFDARNMGYTTEEQWFTEWENGANVYTSPATYDTFNP